MPVLHDPSAVALLSRREVAVIAPVSSVVPMADAQPPTAIVFAVVLPTCDQLVAALVVTAILIVAGCPSDPGRRLSTTKVPPPTTSTLPEALPARPVPPTPVDGRSDGAPDGAPDGRPPPPNPLWHPSPEAGLRMTEPAASCSDGLADEPSALRTLAHIPTSSAFAVVSLTRVSTVFLV
jgi:hypothetical protein